MDSWEKGLLAQCCLWRVACLSQTHQKRRGGAAQQPGGGSVALLMSPSLAHLPTRPLPALRQVPALLLVSGEAGVELEQYSCFFFF